MDTKRWVVIGGLAAGLAACSKTEIAEPPKPAPAATPAPAAPPPPPPPPPRNPDDIPPPDDVKAPPADAEEDRERPRLQGAEARQRGRQKPTLADTVEVHYTGWTTDGRMFDSSVKRGQPARFPSAASSRDGPRGCSSWSWARSARFWIPAELAYGESPGGGRPRACWCSTSSCSASPARPSRPRTSPRRPRTPRRPKSGIAYRVLKKGTGKEHPTAESTVEVHYSGWTTDGKMFDSSVARGQPATFPLARRHPRLDRGRAADGASARRPGSGSRATSPTTTRPAPARRTARWCSTSSCWRSSRRARQAARQRKACRCRRARCRGASASSSSRS